MTLSREWVEPLAGLAVFWAIYCILFGPLTATFVLAGCFILGGPLARWVGRKMFGDGGQ